MEAGKRLAYYVEKQGFTKKDFCNTFEFEYNNMVSVMAEKRSLGINILNKIHESLPNLNIHWVLYGEGPIEVNNTVENILNEPEEEYAIHKDSFEFLLLKYLENPTIKSKINEIVEKKIKELK